MSIDIIKKHLSNTVPFEIEDDEGNKDTLYLKKFNIGEQVLASKVSRLYSKLGIKGETDEVKLNEADPEILGEALRTASDLLTSIIMRSVEGIEEKMAREFVDSNFNDLISVIEKLSPKTKKQEKEYLISERRNATREKSEESEE